MNILTFDIEDWFHINDSDWTPILNWKNLDSRVEKNTIEILQLLKKHQQKATFFIMGWIAETHPELVKLIADEKHEIGYHSYYHMRPKHQSLSEFENDLINGIQIIQKITSLKVETYRAPNLSLSQQTVWTIPILLKHGIKLSSSTKSNFIVNGQRIPKQPFMWQTPSGNLPEFPLNRKSVLGYPLTFTGSGYFRLFPMWFTNYLYNQHTYNNGYFHPNDIDAHVPTPKELGFIRNWLNTVGSATALEKLDILLAKHQFSSVSHAWQVIKDDESLQFLKPY